MKTIEVFCASPASTAICSSTDHRAIVRHRTRTVHRLGESPRTSGAAPCSSHLPFEPSRKSSASKHPDAYRRRSSADVHDLSGATPRRHLLAAKPFSDHQTALIPSRPPLGETDRANHNKRMNLDAFPPAVRSLSTRSHESPVFKPPSSADSAGKLIDHLKAHRSSSFTPLNRHQVVELRVSIHCKGCEGKLRKHISRMEGVTSFSIDLETKKVTVIGNVTPVGVLTSISKVKNAQFWPSPATSSSSSSLSPSPSPRITTFVSPRVSLTRY